MEENKSCETCFWRSISGYCVEGPEPPRVCEEVCDKYTPKINVCDN